jgi:hypothetical protein
MLRRVEKAPMAGCQSGLFAVVHGSVAMDLGPRAAAAHLALPPRGFSWPSCSSINVVAFDAGGASLRPIMFFLVPITLSRCDLGLYKSHNLRESQEGSMHFSSRPPSGMMARSTSFEF